MLLFGHSIPRGHPAPGPRIAVVALAVGALWMVHVATVAAQGVVERFPQPRQVLRDYGDDPSRRVALEVLQSTLIEKTPAPRSDAATRRIAAYVQAIGEVDLRYTRMRRDAPARRDYYTRVGRLRGDPGFRRQVLNRYRLAGLAPEGRPRVAVPPDPLDDPRLFAPAVPYWLATLAVLLVMPLLFQLSAWRAAASTPITNVDDVTNLLPKPLRVLRLSGAPFRMAKEAGTVVENRPDGLWVRTPAAERLWKIPYPKFETREGHFITRIGRSRADGSHQTVLVMNYVTAQYVYPVRIEDPLGPRHSRRPWLVMAAIGATGFALGIGAVVREFGPLQPRVDWAWTWFLGAGISAVVAGITGGATARVLSRIRNWRFKRYVAECVKYAEGVIARMEDLLERAKPDQRDD